MGNAGIDLVDLDINEAGMRLSSRITSWSEAGERLSSRITSWSEAGERLRSRITSWSEAGERLRSRITSWSEAGERLRSRITSWSEADERLRSRITSWSEAGERLRSRITSWSEADERLRSRITSWSEAGERLRSRVTSWSGKTCTASTDSALRRVCPERGNFGGSHGCHELPHSAVGAAQARMDEMIVSVEDADVGAETILDLDVSVVVQSMMLVEEQADAMETTVSSRPEHGGSFVLL